MTRRLSVDYNYTTKSLHHFMLFWRRMYPGKALIKRKTVFTTNKFVFWYILSS